LSRITQPVAKTPEPNQAMSPPAAAGPMIRARLNDAELRPTALETWSGPTISDTNACRLGPSNAVPVPNTKAST
jgi:hypothetical protein